VRACRSQHFLQTAGKYALSTAFEEPIVFEGKPLVIQVRSFVPSNSANSIASRSLSTSATTLNLALSLAPSIVEGTLHE
jgi:hypothetical protein